MDSIIEMLRLIAGMMFVSSLAAQGWIAFLDIVSLFTKDLERFRPLPSQEKVSRVVAIIGIFVLISEEIVILKFS